jgi:hypothetical protein
MRNLSLVFRRFSQICEKRPLASSCPSVRLSEWKNSAPTGRILSLFRKPLEKIQVLLKSDKNNGYFT